MRRRRIVTAETGSAFWEAAALGVLRRRVLVIEDDPDMRKLLRATLERADIDCVETADGRAGLRALYASRPDLVILDVTLPYMDGWTTLARIRDISDVPVMILTAHAFELECVRGLQAGADDYVTKPCGLQELVARIQAILRRAGARHEPAEGYCDGVLAISFAQRSVRVLGNELPLTPLEFRLLAVLVRHGNQVLSAGQLLDLVWGLDGTLSSEVKVYVSYLRRKLRAFGADDLIETARGFGYRYRVPPTPTPV